MESIVHPKLSLVIPCYNEEEVLPEMINIVVRKLESLITNNLVSNDSFIYFVDDGSKDNTWIILESNINKYHCVRGIKLSRNRGHQNALLAGLMTAEGDIIISMDADLQDDIDAIDEMVLKYKEGNDIVYGVRSKRDTDTRFKKFTAQGYYSLLTKLGVDLVYNHADYRLLSRNALNQLREFKEVNLFLRGLIPLLGFKTDTVYYERKERKSGESKYPLKKMLSFALDGITSFSNIPLRLITLFGFFVSMFAFIMTLWGLGIKIFTDQAIPGWASIIIPMFFIGGVQLLSIGVVGEYISKIYLETKGRPRYIVEKIVK